MHTHTHVHTHTHAHTHTHTHTHTQHTCTHYFAAGGSIFDEGPYTLFLFVAVFQTIFLIILFTNVFPIAIW